MESSPPPNLANLNVIFNQLDADQDGRVNYQQIDQIFKQIGYLDVYVGTIKKVIRLLNAKNPQIQTLDFSQVQQFAEGVLTKGKFQVWKAKYQVLEALIDINKELFGEQQNNNAAPGAGPGSEVGSGGSKSQFQVNSQEGQISLNIGNTNQYEQQFNFRLEKEKGKQIKPFIKISIHKKNNEEAQAVEAMFKNIYDTVIELIKAEEQQLISQILSVSFNTIVNQNVFNLLITTENQGLIQLIQLCADFLDLMLKQSINGKIEASYKFNYDFQKFISQGNYNFYDIFVKNCNILIKWNVWDLFKNLRKVLLTGKAFQDLEWDSTQEWCLFLIALLHCQRFSGKLEFNNTETGNQEIKSKEQLVQFLNQMRSQLNEMQEGTQVNVLGFLGQLDGKVQVQAGIKDWKLNLDLNLGAFTKLFTNQIDISEPNSQDQQP